jgi:hypothetical protein
MDEDEVLHEYLCFIRLKICWGGGRVEMLNFLTDKKKTTPLIYGLIPK